MLKGFTVQNWKKKIIGFPCEDSYNLYNRNNIIFLLAVADGITRDCLNGAVADSSIEGIKNIFLHYPRPSPAKIASDIFTKTFPEVIKDFINKNDLAIKEAFKESNKRIRKWNENNFSKRDYLANDFAGCVASGAIINKEFMYWGYIADCGVAVFDSEGKLRFKTNDEGPSKFYKQRWSDERMKNLKWKDDEARIITRRDYRNNINNPCSYGALTGEEEAMEYVRVGGEVVHNGECIITYSDGLEPIIFSGGFSNELKRRNIKGLEKLCKKGVKSEGSLIISSANQ